MTLDQLGIHHKAIIVCIKGESMLRKRLLEMGLIPGTEVEILRVAPMKDPLVIYIRHYTFTLRKEDASLIKVEEVSHV